MFLGITCRSSNQCVDLLKEYYILKLYVRRFLSYALYMGFNPNQSLIKGNWILSFYSLFALKTRQRSQVLEVGDQRIEVFNEPGRFQSLGDFSWRETNSHFKTLLFYEQYYLVMCLSLLYWNCPFTREDLKFNIQQSRGQMLVWRYLGAKFSNLTKSCITLLLRAHVIVMCKTLI